MDPYWQRTIDLGHALLDGSRREVLVKVHQEKEEYHRLREIVPIKKPRGTRTYIHAKAFYAYTMPTLRMVIGPPLSRDTLGPDPEHERRVGTVVHSEVEQEEVRHREMGIAQGWIYDEEEKAVLWECYLFETFRTGGLQANTGPCCRR